MRERQGHAVCCSDRCLLGQFAVAYVGYEMPRRVKHYLVQPTDTASAKKTLPDFLSECHQFQKVLEIEASGEGGYRFRFFLFVNANKTQNLLECTSDTRMTRFPASSPKYFILFSFCIFWSKYCQVDRIDPGAGYDQLVPGGGPAAM